MRFNARVGQILGWFMLAQLAIESANARSDVDLFSLDITELLNVTIEARKVEENLQNTPISVSVMSGEFLEQRALDNLVDAADFIPNITITTVGENSGCTHCAGITIRGVGQVDPIPTTDPSVGLYIDGVYHARSAGSIINFLDIDRVEVLRGPQGTLYGKNSIGGAINVLTNKVSDKQDISTNVTMGEYNRLDTSLLINLPLNNKWATRIAVAKFTEDGFVKRVNGELEGGQDELGLLAKLRYKHSNKLNIELSIDRQLQHNGTAASVLSKKNDDASLISLFNSIANDTSAINTLPPLQIFDDPFLSAATTENENRLNQTGYRSTIEWGVTDKLHLKTIASYRSLDATYGRDFDNNPVNIGFTHDEQTQRQRTLEFNLSCNQNDDFKWLLGLFTIDERISYDFRFVFLEGLFLGLETLPAPMDGSSLSSPTSIGGPNNPLNIGLDLDNTFNNKVDNQSLALFAHTNYRLAPKWTLTTGGRLTWENKKQQVVTHLNVANIIAINRTDQSPEGAIEKSWRVFSPLLGIQYNQSVDSMIFFNASRGFKSGGFNGVANTAVSARPFEPEYLTSFELGMRSQWFDNQLRINSTAFLIKHKDMQLRGGESDENSGVEIFIDNVGNTSTKGMELEVEAQISASINVTASMSYTDAKFTDVGTATEVTTDSKLIKTPRWTAAISIKKDWQLNKDKLLTTRLSWAYRDEVYNDVFNNVHAKQTSISLLNFYLQYPISKQLNVSAFVSNLTNEYHVIGANDFTSAFGVAEYYLAPPRQAGLSLSYQF
ncbi:Vitamin B12 transporter BtuB [Pseudoalteromonas holothuriae]|uniref:Vitamin B12 transporter BtuB n=1 Tax=Pseudoalteromonas holothuriae TaxID=2963714 RepID=A0ABM9GGE4_9GAMM|nr:TonB-dependent receptor [Pseudoalteromonas sp. CIP111951]CAH9055962.1 Vitamin B12 transporter BtuB [Pseudoalteromonas sp. CIP111951]